MIDAAPFAPHVLFHVGPVAIGKVVVTTWVIMAVMGLAPLLAQVRVAIGRPEPAPRSLARRQRVQLGVGVGRWRAA